MKKLIKDNRGITLIAVAVTVVILMILTGISIANISKDNGIIEGAQTADMSVKRKNYLETLEMIGLNIKQQNIRLEGQEYMDKYEEKIKKDKLFKNAKEIVQVENRKPITIQVTTKEGWIYWVTEDEVEDRGTEAERGIYVSLNGTTLSFYDNEEEAYKNKDNEEHYYGDIKNITMNYLSHPWDNDKDIIEKVVIVDIIEPTNMRAYFSGLTNLKIIEDIDKINTSRVTNMTHVFYECKNLENVDVSRFNTANVTSMYGMFWSCNKLIELDVSNFNTSKVNNMGAMFYFCINLKEIDVSRFDTSNVKEMNAMFGQCNKLMKLDVTNFDTSNVTNMDSMFGHCEKLTKLDLTNFNTLNVTNMKNMFMSCGNITNLDLSSFDTSNVTNMEGMFRGSLKLNSIIIGEKWKVPEKATDMFTGCGTDTVTRK